MARFYATIQGTRGPANRVGDKVSGICGHVRGWDVGAEVQCRVVDGRDIVEVWATGGSNGNRPDKLLARFNGTVWHVFNPYQLREQAEARSAEALRDGLR